MSIATDLPSVTFPGRRAAVSAARSSVLAGRPHAVRVVVPRTGRVVPPVPGYGLRLTRRGVVALWAATVVVGLALLIAAYASWQPAAQGAARSASVTTVRVEPGDTLWSIAGRIAPQRDPRNVVEDLRRSNDLGSADLVPGQVLRLG